MTDRHPDEANGHSGEKDRDRDRASWHPDGLHRAVATMHAVRDRCVWTQQMTHRELVPYLIEESAELADAVERDSRAEMREELGDLLWQVLFHAEIASRAETAPFDIDDVAGDLADKMVRRHPHVFADEVATTPDEVLVLWNAAKAAEKRERTSVLDGIAPGMPSLARAQKILGRAESVGVSVSPGPLSAAPDQTAADRGAPEPRAVAGEAGSLAVETEAELGDLLLGAVAVARARGWDAERALRERIRALEDLVRAAESTTSGNSAG